MPVQMKTRACLEMSGDQAHRYADLLERLAMRLYDYGGDAEEPILKEVADEALELRRIGNLALAREEVVGLWETK